NVAFVATEHDGVYAFDADQGTQYWYDSFIDPAHGITTVPYQELSTPDLYPEIGITGTPVIDSSTDTLYVVVKTKEMRSGVAHYVQKLHALDITTGFERPNSPYTIGDTTFGGPHGGFTDSTAIYVYGQGGGADAGRVFFNAARESQRP